ncbi:hypothetical protein FISHEDRAFT_55691 [Fistulina hepatica ATCC 64428]|uniref:Uncharacterized protein n=1 Tax=Fistulina hepatica ATCC 64428 TaxID=1128425 RepID=A0A0D7ALT7_9AGAR|nr:hypothetical protein FISHEDRAFT_55691 [Fistulina hepatica ATCC 64428]
MDLRLMHLLKWLPASQLTCIESPSDADSNQGIVDRVYSNDVLTVSELSITVTPAELASRCSRQSYRVQFSINLSFALLIMSSTRDDPRDASKETPFKLPSTWYREEDTIGSTGMLLSGVIIMTRNRYMAWAALFFALSQWTNHHPMRAKEGGGPVASLMLTLSALIPTVQKKVAASS